MELQLVYACASAAGSASVPWERFRDRSEVCEELNVFLQVLVAHRVPERSAKPVFTSRRLFVHQYYSARDAPCAGIRTRTLSKWPWREHPHSVEQHCTRSVMFSALNNKPTDKEQHITRSDKQKGNICVLYIHLFCHKNLFVKTLQAANWNHLCHDKKNVRRISLLFK